jgi:uncharacterized membrane protein YsdA (DUF1294 family)
MSNIVYITTIATVVCNVVTFALYGIDKRKAKKDRRRISETTLIVCAFLMGGIGAFLGMKLFRHKTQHLKFKILIPMAILANIGIIVLLRYVGVFTLSP